MPAKPKPNQSASLLALIKPYAGFISLLTIFAILSNGANLILPRITAQAIDDYTAGQFSFRTVLWKFLLISLLVFVFTYLQSIIQVIASERVARDLRTQLIAKLSSQTYAYVQKITPARLLTNLTADIEAIKLFVAQAVASLISSIFLIIAASVLLILLDWKLALAILSIVPIIGIVFFVLLKKVRILFKKAQEVIDWLNGVINESILGSALVRVLNAQKAETQRFQSANTQARDLGLGILNIFAYLIPTVNFVSNLATLTIFTLGGYFVINEAMTLGNYAAFNNYLFLLIFPIVVIGFTSNLIAQTAVSYQRILEVMRAPEKTRGGQITAALQGQIEFDQVSLAYGQKPVLKKVSFSVPAKTRTAIIGPTAAGKSQLLYLLSALIDQTAGEIKYDGRKITDYDQNALLSQVGLVFQDSLIFNLSLRENIAFSDQVKDDDLTRALAAAELQDFVASLDKGLDTIVSERGSSLSGGQKQRIMLARALAINPKVLLLDDFTARVDAETEKKILANIARNYPDLTLLSVTQKIDPIKDYDQIILLMEGELLASGTHEELMNQSPEYVQIYNSQQSTNRYDELSA